MQQVELQVIPTSNAVNTSLQTACVFGALQQLYSYFCVVNLFTGQSHHRDLFLSFSAHWCMYKLSKLISTRVLELNLIHGR